MSDFDFDVVTGPSKASCPAVPGDPAPEEERRRDEPPIAPVRSAGS